MKKSTISARIKEIMHQKGLNQQQLASYLGVSQPAISLYLRGRVPPADILLRLARIGKTTMEWVLTGESGPTGTRIAEAKSDYGNENWLRDLWIHLSPGQQKIILTLMRELTGKKS